MQRRRVSSFKARGSTTRSVDGAACISCMFIFGLLGAGRRERKIGAGRRIVVLRREGQLQWPLEFVPRVLFLLSHSTTLSVPSLICLPSAIFYFRVLSVIY
jgi:hypothetical protein